MCAYTFGTYFNLKFVDYCDQAESIRDTCSRDPAHYELDVLMYMLVVFF